MMTYLTPLLFLVPILTASVAQILFKKGVSDWGYIDFSTSGVISLIPRIFQSGWLLAGAFLFGISLITYLFVLSKFQLNIVYPIFVSSGIIIISLGSWFFFKESLSLPQILGIIAIIFGIFLLLPKS